MKDGSFDEDEDEDEDEDGSFDDDWEQFLENKCRKPFCKFRYLHRFLILKPVHKMH